MKLSLSQKTSILIIVPAALNVILWLGLLLLVFGFAQQWFNIQLNAVLRLAAILTMLGAASSVLFAIILNHYLKLSIFGPLQSLSDRFQINRSQSPKSAAGSADSADSAIDQIDQLDQEFRILSETLQELTEKEVAVLSYASDVICSFDLAGKCLSMNPASKRLWGYDPQELVNKDIFAVIAQSDQQQLMGHVHSVHVKMGPGEYELKVRRKDGSLADTLWSLYWSVEHSWIVGVVHDITARKEAERMQAEFTAMITHDLRSPLATIQMFLQALDAGLWGTISEEARSNGLKARGLLDRLLRLTAELLSFEKFEAGEIALNLQKLDLSSVLSEAVHSVSGMAKLSHVNIVVPAYSATTLHGDREKLIQILTNLLSNAIKYSPQNGAVTVLVTEDPDFLVVQISDNGPGISDANKGIIFEKFRQANSPNNKQGTGLGLAICRRFVDLHGGRIGVADGTSGGSTFWFKLPKSPINSNGAYKSS